MASSLSPERAIRTRSCRSAARSLANSRPKPPEAPVTIARAAALWLDDDKPRLASPPIDVRDKGLDVFAFVGRLVVLQPSVLPKVHHNDWVATGEIVDVVVADPDVEELQRIRVLVSNRPPDAAHAARCREVFLPLIDVAEGVANGVVQLARFQRRR